MPAQNTLNRYGLIARALHWLSALLILSAIPLGIIATDMVVSPETIGTKTQLFSVHKTLGLAAFFLGLARIVNALTQPRPVPLHPERRVETALAALVHGLLYLSLVAVPLSGWVHHASVDGFAPILWPFGQDLPFVPKSEALSEAAKALHGTFIWILFVALALHVAGALKHHLIDRDDTLRRMTRGQPAPERPRAAGGHAAPLALALALYAAGTTAALTLAPQTEAAGEAPAEISAAAGGNWQVDSGSLGFTVQQMGAPVDGQFASWTAAITFDDTVSTGKAGQVVVEIDLTSLTLGSVTDQAKGPEFFDVANHPTARFTADLLVENGSYFANGILNLHGMEKPVTLPFTLGVDGDKARMSAEVRLDRRDFGIGAGYEDEATVGHAVTVKVGLEANRS